MGRFRSWNQIIALLAIVGVTGGLIKRVIDRSGDASVMEQYTDTHAESNSGARADALGLASTPANPPSDSRTPASANTTADTASTAAQDAAVIRSQEPVAQVPPVSPTTTKTTDDPLAKVFSQLATQAFPRRVSQWADYLHSETWLRDQAKFFNGGPAFGDIVPLIPPKWDCTTFVETVVALSRSHSMGEFVEQLLGVRYRDGKPTYIARNHFPEADWIPANEKRGVLKDTTQMIAQAAGLASGVVSKRIDRGAWLDAQVNSGKVPLKALPRADDPQLAGFRTPTEVTLAWISPKEVERMLRSSPPAMVQAALDGAVINLVREDNPRQPVLISHQGILVRDGDQWMLKHSTPAGEVRSRPLVSYLENAKTSGMSKTWKLLGININTLMPPAGEKAVQLGTR